MELPELQDLGEGDNQEVRKPRPQGDLSKDEDERKESLEEVWLFEKANQMKKEANRFLQDIGSKAR